MSVSLDLSALRRFAASLPGTSEAPHMELMSARVGTRIFLTWPVDGSRVHVFVDEATTQAAIAAGVGAELRWGKSLAGLRVPLPADAAALEPLIVASWRRKTPKRMLAIFDARGS